MRSASGCIVAGKAIVMAGLATPGHCGQLRINSRDLGKPPNTAKTSGLRSRL